ncbi:glycosyltransferase family 2 protein [Flavobacterium geliluteum]|uniref:Glycosyltransferase n=1 Tax=Flavobacterium geliluteum TaxID=2816120 RepID=A0A940XE03_9FLAO|nr:glycosyltransferase [Flavobacterium geliluteum]MBP4137573.1 glycosyltransferase [Flavobacterium geliluteum]
MLSILIPVYNYDVFALVETLHKQCLEIEIEFEILCLDDASPSQKNIKNQEINAITNCSFFVNKTNLGRGKNINSLAKNAKYDWLLILDCDTYPAENNFIKKYYSSIIRQKHKIVFGGIVYETQKPEKERLLRWVYGCKRESLDLSKRNKNSHFSGLTSNLLIKKEIFNQYCFDESIIKYGYEDLYFFAILRINHFEVKHIENRVFHLNLETSIEFLNKTKIALNNLCFLYNSKKLSEKESKIIKTFHLVQLLKLTFFVILIFKKSRIIIEENLLSKKPSLFLFDFYKLGYFCCLKNQIIL